MTTRRLRVCHVSYSFYENDARVQQYAEALAQRGHHVEVIALRRPGRLMRQDAHGVRVLGIQRRVRNERGTAHYLAKILLFWVKAFCWLAVAGPRRRYDAVHVHNVPDFLVFAATVPKLWGARIILDIHDLLPELFASKFGLSSRSLVFRILLWLELISCRFADHVIVANHLWRDRLVTRSVTARRCSAFLNYPDESFFAAARRRTEGTESGFTILYPGTLNHHQGLDLAIEAFARVRHLMPDARLLIHGDGPARDLLRKQVEALGLDGYVVLREPVPVHDVPRLMASADLAVVPKRADGFGNEAFSTKVLQFMAAGVPVILSRTAIDAHYFDDRCVRFFAPGDAEDLAKQLLWAYQHRAELRDLSRAARDVAQLYRRDRHMDDYARLVEGTQVNSVALGVGGSTC